MEDQTIKELWLIYQQHIDRSLVVHQKNTEAITTLQVRSLLSTMKPIKLLAVGIGIIWIVGLDSQLAKMALTGRIGAAPFFFYSALLQSLLTTWAVGVYIYQLLLIQQINVAEPIVSTQERLSRLRTSTLHITRILFLQLPLWTTFYWNDQLIHNGSLTLMLQSIVTLSFAIAAGWLFMNIHYGNRHKRWFRLLFDGPEWTPLLKSMQLLEQLEIYQETIFSK